jgi:murein DD-endopeptidase MepM/ murein hydrolase activator NlpD
MFLEEAYANPDFIALIDTSKAQIDLQRLSESFTQLEQQYQRVAQQQAIIEKQYGNVQESIERILTESARIQQQVTNTLTQIALLSRRVEELRAWMRDIYDDYQKSKEDLAVYTRFLYVLFNNYYWWWSNSNDISLLIRSDNVAKSLVMHDSVVMMTAHIQTLMDTMKQKQHQYAQAIFELNRTQMVYREAWRSLERDLDALNQQKTSLYDLLAYLQTTRNIVWYEASLVQWSQAMMAHQIDQLRRMTTTWWRAVAWTLAADLLKLPDSEDWDKYLTWPVLWTPRISQYFTDTEDWDQFTWVRFVVPQRSHVFAVAPGIVYRVVWENDMSQAWIIMLHKHWYATFYTPMNEIFVEEWALVARWAVIGMSGWQPWTLWAWIDAQAPHLDFAVAKNAQFIDPLSLLDISIYHSQEDLPEQYHHQYIKNMLDRQVIVERLWFMPWNTLAERRLVFLRRYAHWAFADPNLWEDAAYGSGIDPHFGICIWFAETSFRNFKSKNNIWNVWNNDRGDVVEFFIATCWSKSNIWCL